MSTRNSFSSWKALRDKAIAEYHPALVTERLCSFSTRRWIHSVVGWLTVASGFGVAVFASSPDSVLETRTLGIFFIALALWITSACLRALHYYYLAVADISFGLAHILYRSSPADPVAGFVRSHFGRRALARIGASNDDVRDFLKNRPIIVSAEHVSVGQVFMSTAASSDLTRYAEALLAADTHFGHFIASYGIRPGEFAAVCDWLCRTDAAQLAAERWWSRESLGRIRGIGKTWAYGRLFELEKFERFLPQPSVSVSTVNSYGAKELGELEAVLLRRRFPNAFLVGDDLEKKIDIVSRLETMIEEGSVMPELEHKRLVVLDTDIVVSAAESMSSFERLIRNLAGEAARAGNIILVFMDFPAFLGAARSFGLDAASFLDPFFTAPELQIIALSAVEPYHELIERTPALQERFDTVFLEPVDAAATLRIIEQEVPALERRHRLFFTYQSLTALVAGAERYVVSGIEPEKSLGLLHEFAPRAAMRRSRDGSAWESNTNERHDGGRGSTTILKPAKQLTVIRREDVEDFLQTKTGIPMGQIDEGERARLLNLEKILHQRIVGQDEAVNAISAAVRRARSGITNPARPLASFLFLGPTGVGKTETTKALSDIFFGHSADINEAGIKRLDMSEYAGADALEKLIGEYGARGAAGSKTAGGSDEGILATMVREHPYGVLLLDEFEKTTAEVMNLFLQILDEGFFSDGAGAKVNCRNLLIIATSNAGAELIWDAVARGSDLSHSRELILDSLIHSGAFKPELLNRFDGIIIFHPLAREHLEKIAKLQLEKLSRRLAERGISLVVTDDLVQYVMRFGTDPKFGARPMARAVQDKVEQIVAEKLIRDELKPGDEVKITAADLK